MKISLNTETNRFYRLDGGVFGISVVVMPAEGSKASNEEGVEIITSEEAVYLVTHGARLVIDDGCDVKATNVSTGCEVA